MEEQRRIMSADTADIVAQTGASFSFTSTSGSIVGAIFKGASTGTVSADVPSNTVSVSNLPAGDSTLLLTIIWAPGEANGKLLIINSAHPLAYVTSADILTDGVTPGIVELSR
jgi:hypothetical protein